jgi:1,4-alpha-glucan branching enzyme
MGVQLHCLDRHLFPLQPRAGDVIHLHSLGLANLALELNSRFNLRLLYTAHSIVRKELPPGADGEVWSNLQHLLFQKADHVFFLCCEERRLGMQVCPSVEHKSNVLPHGLTIRDDVDYQVSPHGPVVFAGRFCHLKGIDVFIETARELLKRNGKQRFAIAGGHGDEPETVAVHTFALQFPENCRLYGWTPRAALDNLFARASLVLIPSRYEPFGMVALEALRMGAPVLAASTGGLAEIVSAQSGATLISGYNPVEWADQCEALLSSQMNTPQLRRQRTRYIAARYDVLRHAKILLRYTEPRSAATCPIP